MQLNKTNNMDIVAYKQGSNWIISVWNEHFGGWITQQMPYYYKTKKSIKEYCKSVFNSSVDFA